MLKLAELEKESPERLAQLIIDLSQIMEGVQDDPRKTFSYGLIQKIVAAGSGELAAMMREPLRLLPLYFSIVQHILLQHVDSPAELERILDTMDSHQRSGTRDNEYLQVVRDTYSRTLANSRAVYARMEKLAEELARFEQDTDEQNQDFKDKMDALTAELELEQQGVFAKTDLLLEKLEQMTSAAGGRGEIGPVPARVLVTLGKKAENLIIGAVVLLFIIVSLALLSR